MSAPSFPGSGASIAGSPAPDSATPSSVSGTSGAAPSSPPASPASPCFTTSGQSHLPARSRVADPDLIAPTLDCGEGRGPLVFVKATKAHEQADHERWEETETAPTLDAGGQQARTATAILTSSPEDSPVRTFPRPESAAASRASDPACSSSSPESQGSLFAPAATFWSKTSRVSLLPTEDGILVPSSGRWPTSGFSTSRGEFSTPSSSEWPSGGGACSSLRDVLQDDAPPKFYLSPRAAAGILRRAQRRGKKLPEPLRLALEAAVATGMADK